MHEISPDNVRYDHFSTKARRFSIADDEQQSVERGFFLDSFFFPPISATSFQLIREDGEECREVAFWGHQESSRVTPRFCPLASSYRVPFDFLPSATSKRQPTERSSALETFREHTHRADTTPELDCGQVLKAWDIRAIYPPKSAAPSLQSGPC